jgi:hypothetical protein
MVPATFLGFIPGFFGIMQVGRYPPGFKSWCPQLFLVYSGILRRYALSGKRRSHRRRGANGNFGNL